MATTLAKRIAFGRTKFCRNAAYQPVTLGVVATRLLQSAVDEAAQGAARA